MQAVLFIIAPLHIGESSSEAYIAGFFFKNFILITRYAYELKKA
jgi:hypothetical protein